MAKQGSWMHGERVREVPAEVFVPAMEAAEGALQLQAYAMPSSEQPLWHYTTTEAASHILSSGKMWATDADYLNDTTELRAMEHHFADEIRRRRQVRPGPRVEEAAHVLDNLFRGVMRTTYVASFTSLEDDLSQWRAYADDGGGCALSFDPTALSEVADFTLIPCRYPDDEELRSTIRRILDAADNFARLETQIDEFRARLTIHLAAEMIGPIIKAKAFRGEEEVRLYCTREPRRIGVDDETPFDGRLARVKGDLFVPYAEIDISEALTSVMIGPKHQADYRRRAYGLRAFIGATGYTESRLAITGSRQPYRG